MKQVSQVNIADDELMDEEIQISFKKPMILGLAVLLTCCFPLGVIIAQVTEIYLLMTDETQLLKPLQFITNGAMGLEAFLESGPQTILQLYIIFDTKKIFFTQAASILISLVSLA